MLANTTTETNPEVYLIIVDGDHDNCAFIQDYFQQVNWHHHVKTLTDADKLFTLLDATPHAQLLPSLIVLDYNMPRLGGEIILMLLKRDDRFKNIPVALYSTSMTERKEKELLRLGAHFCRRKPTTLKGMSELMTELQSFAQSLRPSSTATSTENLA